MKINKKNLLSFFCLIGLCFNLAFPATAFAYSFNVGPYSTSIDVNAIIGEVSTDSISSIVGDSANSVKESDVWKTAKRKETAPGVEIFFDNENPKAGQKVTVHAVPEFFKNDPQNLYYTWYIIHTDDGTIQSATNTIEDGKAEASRISASGDYDPDLDGQDYDDPNDDPDEDGWPAVDANSFDEDATAAPMGGADGVGGLTEETVEDYSSSGEWCDSLGGHSWSNCSLFDGSDYKPLSSYYTPGTSQNNYYCNLCKNYFSGDGAVSYSSAQSIRNTCCYNAIPEASLQCSSTDPGDGTTTYSKCPQDSSTDYCGITESSLFSGCYDAFREANKSTLNTCLDNEYSSCQTNWANVHEDTNGDGFSDASEEDTTQVSRCYKHNFGTNTDAGVFRENELSDSTTSDSSGLDISIPCKHEWENAAGYKSGSGEFSTGEEEKWETDPTDPDTDGDGFVDEADVVGLGQQDFSWTYRSGDRVGVVVEGTSMIPTDEKNAYYKIMWGHLDVCDKTKTKLMEKDDCDEPSDYGYGFLATKSPSEEDEENIKLSLSYSPDNPTADPSSANEENISSDGTILNADQVTVISSLDNSESDPDDLYYTWQISEGTLEEDKWEEITDLESNFDMDTPSSGTGISQLRFTPKKDALESDDDIVYFRVTLTASQASEVEEGKGRSSVVIPYNKNGLKIALHKVEIADGKAEIGDEVCTESLYLSLCPALQGQMLAAKVSSSKFNSSNTDFSWKVNGNSLYSPADASTLFEGWNSASVFFPITMDEQEIEEISVTATPKDKLEAVESSRLVTVVHPAVFIKSADLQSAWPATYNAQDPEQKQSYVTVESSNMFNALTNSTASFYLDFVPYYILGEDINSQIDWQVNGTSVHDVDFYENNQDVSLFELQDEDRTLKIDMSENEGAYYDISAEIEKLWSEEEKNILYSAWGVTPKNQDGEAAISVSTTLDPQSSDEISLGKPKQIFAAIGNNLSHYFMYNLRLALTMMVMFFASSVLYGLTRSLSKNYENE